MWISPMKHNMLWPTGNTLFTAMTKEPAMFTADYKDTYTYSYQMRKEALNHKYVIHCFEEALQHPEWPENNNAVKQQFQTRPLFNHNLVTKTEWDITLFVQKTDMSDNIMTDDV